MFSIGEFARLGTVSVRTLRHYDEIGLLRPARVDPETGYRGYSADQLGQLNRIIALKELGLSLAQVRRLLGGITLEELQGMLMLRRAQLETELDAYKNKLLGVEARLRYIARECTVPADDITVKKIPAMGVIAIAAPGSGLRRGAYRSRRQPFTRAVRSARNPRAGQGGGALPSLLRARRRHRYHGLPGPAGG